jgi:hypothetical protein
MATKIDLYFTLVSFENCAVAVGLDVRCFSKWLSFPMRTTADKLEPGQAGFVTGNDR